MELPNPLGVTRDAQQRFYFHDTTGSILPGHVHEFGFVFKTPNPGHFTEVSGSHLASFFECLPFVLGMTRMMLLFKLYYPETVLSDCLLMTTFY